MNCSERSATLKSKSRKTALRSKTAKMCRVRPILARSSTLKRIWRRPKMRSWNHRKTPSTWKRTTWSCLSCVTCSRRPRDSSTKRRPSITMQCATTWLAKRIRKTSTAAVSALLPASFNASAFPALSECCGASRVETFSCVKPKWTRHLKTHRLWVWDEIR